MTLVCMCVCMFVLFVCSRRLLRSTRVAGSASWWSFRCSHRCSSSLILLICVISDRFDMSFGNLLSRALDTRSTMHNQKQWISSMFDVHTYYVFTLGAWVEFPADKIHSYRRNWFGARTIQSARKSRTTSSICRRLLWTVTMDQWRCTNERQCCTHH